MESKTKKLRVCIKIPRATAKDSVTAIKLADKANCINTCSKLGKVGKENRGTRYG